MLPNSTSLPPVHAQSQATLQTSSYVQFKQQGLSLSPMLAIVLMKPAGQQPGSGHSYLRSSI